MKVCVFASGSFENNYSSYHLMRDLIDELLVQDNEVCLIQKCFGKPGCLPRLLQNRKGLQVIDVPCRLAAKANFVKRMLFDLRYYYDASFAIKRACEYDVFFLQSNNTPYLPIWLIRRYANKPVVYNVQDVFPQNAAYAKLLKEKSILYRMLCRLQKWALQHSDSIVTVSEDMKDTLVNAGASETRISVAYNWENGLHQENPAQQKTEDGTFHVVYAGNIGRMQNVEVVLRAANLLKGYPEIQFDFYGAGALKQRCVEFAQKQSLKNVMFHDPLPADQAYRLYYNADINIVPLTKGIIKTALPSKTAVCIQCDKPAIFCIDKASKFAAQISCVPGYTVVDSEDFETLADELLIAERTNGARSVFNKELKKQFDRQQSFNVYQQVFRRTVMETCHE